MFNFEEKCEETPFDKAWEIISSSMCKNVDPRGLRLFLELEADLKQGLIDNQFSDAYIIIRAQEHTWLQYGAKHTFLSNGSKEDLSFVEEDASSTHVELNHWLSRFSKLWGFTLEEATTLSLAAGEEHHIKASEAFTSGQSWEDRPDFLTPNSLIRVWENIISGSLPAGESHPKLDSAAQWPGITVVNRKQQAPDDMSPWGVGSSSTKTPSPDTPRSAEDGWSEGAFISREDELIPIKKVMSTNPKECSLGFDLLTQDLHIKPSSSSLVTQASVVMNLRPAVVNVPDISEDGSLPPTLASMRRHGTTLEQIHQWSDRGLEITGELELPPNFMANCQTAGTAEGIGMVLPSEDVAQIGSVLDALSLQ